MLKCESAIDTSHRVEPHAVAVKTLDVRCEAPLQLQRCVGRSCVLCALKQFCPFSSMCGRRVLAHGCICANGVPSRRRADSAKLRNELREPTTQRQHVRRAHEVAQVPVGVGFRTYADAVAAAGEAREQLRDRRQVVIDQRRGRLRRTLGASGGSAASGYATLPNQRPGVVALLHLGGAQDDVPDVARSCRSGRCRPKSSRGRVGSSRSTANLAIFGTTLATSARSRHTCGHILGALFAPGIEASMHREGWPPTGQRPNRSTCDLGLR